MKWLFFSILAEQQASQNFRRHLKPGKEYSLKMLCLEISGMNYRNVSLSMSLGVLRWVTLSLPFLLVDEITG